MIAGAPDMEPIQLGYSFKNIRTGNKDIYLGKIYEQANRFIRRLRWKVYWWKNGEKEREDKGRFDALFPTRKPAPWDKDLVDFENEFYDMIEEIKFTKRNNQLTTKITRDLRELKNSNKVILFGDKTSNIYKIDKTRYERLLFENITRDYKKTEDSAIEKNKQRGCWFGNQEQTKR